MCSVLPLTSLYLPLAGLTVPRRQARGRTRGVPLFWNITRQPGQKCRPIVQCFRGKQSRSCTARAFSYVSRSENKPVCLNDQSDTTLCLFYPHDILAWHVATCTSVSLSQSLSLWRGRKSCSSIFTLRWGKKFTARLPNSYKRGSDEHPVYARRRRRRESTRVFHGSAGATGNSR